MWLRVRTTVVRSGPAAQGRRSLSDVKSYPRDIFSYYLLTNSPFWHSAWLICLGNGSEMSTGSSSSNHKKQKDPVHAWQSRKTQQQSSWQLNFSLISNQNSKLGLIQLAQSQGFSSSATRGHKNGGERGKNRERSGPRKKDLHHPPALTALLWDFKREQDPGKCLVRTHGVSS